MFIPIKDLIAMGTGVVFLLIWLIIFFSSRKYDVIFSGLNEEEYRLKNLYSTGYAVMNIIGYQYTSESDRKIRQQIEVLYEKKYTDFYLRLMYSRALTYAMLIVLCFYILYGISSEILLVFIGYLYAGLAFYYFMRTTQKKIEERSDELLRDFSEVVSKLALLTNAGLSIREAWKTTAENGIGLFYQEMEFSLSEMENGLSEMEAIRRFGSRCVIPEIKRFSATIIQGIKKGNTELSIMLQNQSSEVWNMRKQYARRQGEKAATKLLAPMLLMFVGIIIMIVVPIFANLGI